ncbi:MAG: glycosyltransferase family 4 protein [Thermoanaerobaculia bacterium]
MRIFVLLSRFPHPLDKGDRLRAFHQVAELSRRHEVVLCALAHEEVSDASRAAVSAICSRLEVIPLSRSGTALGMARALVTGLPLQVGFFLSGRARRRVRELVAETAPDRLLFQLVRTAEYSRGLEEASAIDLMDAFSWGLEQRARHSPSWLAPFLRFEARRVARYEEDALRRFRRASVVTVQDREHLPRVSRGNVAVVGNGVDFDAFAPRDAAKEADLLFVGNMAYPPNVLAAETLVREVLPRVRAERPARVLIAGTSPVARVRRLAGDGVEVTGRVEDIASCYARSRVFVAPLTVATGLQNKLLQALAMGIPCVTSEAARRALGASENEMRSGRDAHEVAAAVLELLRDPLAAEELGRRGRAFALRDFRWPAAAEALERVVCAEAG